MLAHFFVSSCDGALHDTRRENWASKPLRQTFSRTFTRIKNTQQLLATLRAGEYAWPGGYPMYFITSDGAALHFDCVRANLRAVSDSVRNNLRDGWKVEAVDINYEDGELTCDDCGKRIESAYSD